MPAHTHQTHSQCSTDIYIQKSSMIMKEALFIVVQRDAMDGCIYEAKNKNVSCCYEGEWNKKVGTTQKEFKTETLS